MIDLTNKRTKERNRNKAIYVSLLVAGGLMVGGIQFMNQINKPIDSLEAVINSPDTTFVEKELPRQYYIVQGGDYLSKIANKIGVEYTELQRFNPKITDWNKIYAGDTLFYQITDK